MFLCNSGTLWDSLLGFHSVSWNGGEAYSRWCLYKRHILECTRSLGFFEGQLGLELSLRLWEYGQLAHRQARAAVSNTRFPSWDLTFQHFLCLFHPFFCFVCHQSFQMCLLKMWGRDKTVGCNVKYFFLLILDWMIGPKHLTLEGS